MIVGEGEERKTSDCGGGNERGVMKRNKGKSRRLKKGLCSCGSGSGGGKGKKRVTKKGRKREDIKKKKRKEVATW